MNQAKNNMLTQQLKACGIHQSSLLDLFSNVPREEFVPEKFQAMAFSDSRIPLGHQQTMMTPLEEALILQALDIHPEHTVLEVGTGSGYLTALLASQAKHVFSIDYYKEFTYSAQKKLERHHIQNVTLLTGDGIHGYLEKAPYDRIVLTGSVNHLDKCFHAQLLQKGKLLAIINKKGTSMEACLFTLDSQEKWHQSMLFETSITPLIDRFKPAAFQF